MNMPCGSDFEKNFYSSSMTLSDLHRSEKEVLKAVKETIIKKDKYYNGEKKNTTIKMK